MHPTGMHSGSLCIVIHTYQTGQLHVQFIMGLIAKGVNSMANRVLSFMRLEEALSKNND